MKTNPDNRIKCPKCDSGNNKIKSSRYIKNDNVYIRKRECINCDNIFETVEMLKDNYNAATQISKGIVRLIKDNLYYEEDIDGDEES